FDQPRSLGKGATGGGLSAPVFKEFMAAALEGEPKVDFRVPEGMTVLPIDRKTGMRAAAGQPGVIMEAFKPGTGPADTYQVIGMDAFGGLEGEERANAISPQARQAISSGGGGLY